jgi:putative dehydrogenase
MSLREPASRALVVRAHGLDIRIVGGGMGAASALKMSYAGITKGLTALGAAMMLGATRAGVAEALHAELAASQPALLPWFTRQIPGMYQKAYRWVAAMDEIADFLGDDPAAAKMFSGAARLYERLARDGSGSTQQTAELARFLDRSQVRRAS